MHQTSRLVPVSRISLGQSPWGHVSHEEAIRQLERARDQARERHNARLERHNARVDSLNARRGFTANAITDLTAIDNTLTDSIGLTVLDYVRMATPRGLHVGTVVRRDPVTHFAQVIYNGIGSIIRDQNTGTHWVHEAHYRVPTRTASGNRVRRACVECERMTTVRCSRGCHSFVCSAHRQINGACRGHWCILVNCLYAR